MTKCRYCFEKDTDWKWSIPVLFLNENFCSFYCYLRGNAVINIFFGSGVLIIGLFIDWTIINGIGTGLTPFTLGVLIDIAGIIQILVGIIGLTKRDSTYGIRKFEFEEKLKVDASFEHENIYEVEDKNWKLKVRTKESIKEKKIVPKPRTITGEGLSPSEWSLLKSKGFTREEAIEFKKSGRTLEDEENG